MIESIGFPRMFNINATVVKYDHDATVQNYKNLLWSEKYELFGDPGYGINIKGHIHDQNGVVLRDLIADEVLVQSANFMPQLTVKRPDIKIVQEGSDFHAEIKAMNNLDYTTDLYNILLFKEGDNNDK